MTINTNYQNQFEPISPRKTSHRNHDSLSTEGRVSAAGREALFSPISVIHKYSPELRSLSLGMTSYRTETPVALYGDGFNHLTEKTIEKIENSVGFEKLFYAAEMFNEEKNLIPGAVLYFRIEEVAKFELQNEQSFEKFFSIFNLAYLEKEHKKNFENLLHCIVIIEDRIFIHPKVEHCEERYGKVIEYKINHTSLSNGKDVTFAGTIRKINGRWLMNNYSGHYNTPSSKLESLLFVLQQKGIPLENVDFAEYTVDGNKLVNKIVSLDLVNERLNSTIRSFSSLTV